MLRSDPDIVLIGEVRDEETDTSYSGRVALYEVMPISGNIRHLIEASTEEIFAAAVGAGMITLREDGIRLRRTGTTSLEEVHRVTRRPPDVAAA